MATRCSGSSPRLRGTLQVMNGGNGAMRFIPAPAGNTPVPVWGVVYKAVHPRACGEHAELERSTWGDGGSSPRLRGTLSM